MDKPPVVTTLTAKQQRFLNFYLTCWNATHAARLADYAHPNKQGPELIKQPHIAAAIQERVTEEAMSADEVLSRLSQQARAEYGAYIKVVDRLNGTRELGIDVDALVADGKGHLIRKISWTRSGDQIIEFYDAHSALVDIGRYHALFKDGVNLNLDLSGMSDDELNDLDGSL